MPLWRRGVSDPAAQCRRHRATAARDRAEVIRGAVKSLSVAYRGQTLASLTVSLGVATFPDHAGDSAALITAADAAMYAAKHGGRDQVSVASGSVEWPPTAVVAPRPNRRRQLPR